ncbi:hypothetical protein [Microbulbifer sp.]|uniref:hypothetical protein n=1 Tax=Microbulbifer sp. TaxID=1908541 RepID=UPI002F94DCD2
MHRRLIAIFLLLFPALACTAAEDGDMSANEVSRQLSNPNTSLARLTFKNQFRWFEGSLPGADNQRGYELLFQPSFPIKLGGGDMFFLRPAFPVFFDQPVFDADKGRFTQELGLGDIGFDVSYGHTTGSGIIFSAGVAGSLPTATVSELGTGQMTLGPELFIGKMSKKYILGFFPNHQWDVAGWGDEDISVTTLQPIAVYLPGNAWSIATSPIATYNWRTETWTTPINLAVSKTVILGETPWRFGMEFNYYVERPDAFGPQWMVGINIVPVVENVFARWFQKNPQETN